MNTSIKFAFNIPTEKIIHVFEAQNGESCNSKCLECGEKLLAVQGEVNDWHFRHKLETNCKGAQELALHKFAKRIIAENDEIAIPIYGLVNYINSVLEKKIYSIIPDVTVSSRGYLVCFEVAVTNLKKEVTKEVYRKNELKCVEIFLDKNAIDWPFEKLKAYILYETKNKAIIFWEKEQAALNEVSLPVKNQTEKSEPSIFEVIFKMFAFITIVFAGIYLFVNFVEWLFTPKNKTAR